MSIWDTYPDLSNNELRELSAVAAQVMLESDEGAAQFAPDYLQQSPAASAREITPNLAAVDPSVSTADVREAFEDEELAAQLCRAVLDQVRTHPELADRVANAYEARRQKMTGIELILVASALVVLAIKIKRLRWGPSGGDIEFEPSGKAVEVFVAGVVKGITGRI